MGRIIGVLNYKGGTAKTTTVVNLGAGLALRGARVLCIDMDPQGSLATYLGVSFDCSVKDLLLGVAGPRDCIRNARPRLDIIASDASLLQAEGTLWKLDDRSSAHELFVSRMQGLDANYDYVIMDYSPSANLLGESALRYTSEIIVPVAMNYLALVGTRQVIQTIQALVAQENSRLRLALIVPTFYDARLRKDNEIMETLHRHFDGRVADPIHSSVRLAEAPGHQMSIFEYAPKSKGAIDYARLVERVSDG